MSGWGLSPHNAFTPSAMVFDSSSGEVISQAKFHRSQLALFHSLTTISISSYSFCAKSFLSSHFSALFLVLSVFHSAALYSSLLSPFPQATPFIFLFQNTDLSQACVNSSSWGCLDLNQGWGSPVICLLPVP